MVPRVDGRLIPNPRLLNTRFPKLLSSVACVVATSTVLIGSFPCVLVVVPPHVSGCPWCSVLVDVSSMLGLLCPRCGGYYFALLPTPVSLHGSFRSIVSFASLGLSVLLYDDCINKLISYLIFCHIYLYLSRPF